MLLFNNLALNSYFRYLKGFVEEIHTNSETNITLPSVESNNPIITDTMTDNTNSTLDLILKKLTLIEENQKILNDENSKRAEEIKTLALKTNMLQLTEDEESDDINETNRKHKNSFKDPRQKLEGENSNNFSWEEEFLETGNNEFPSQQAPGATGGYGTQTLSQRVNSETFPASEIIRTIEILNGQDDVGVQDFILNVKRAISKCSQPGLLLDFVKTEKILGNAKRAIRHCPVNTFEELFEALKINLNSETSVELCRTKLENCRQNNDSVQVYNQKYRQVFNELKYAIQSKHSGPISRRVALQIEEQAAIKRYIMNLRDEIGSQVRPLKPSTIVNAQQEALEAETWYREKLKSKVLTIAKSHPHTNNTRSENSNRRQFPHQQIHNKEKQFEPPNHNLPLSQRSMMTCNFCKKLGHTENQCYHKQNSNFHGTQNQKRPPQRIHYTTETVSEEEINHKEVEKEETIEIASIESVAYPEDYNQPPYNLLDSNEICDSSWIQDLQ